MCMKRLRETLLVYDIMPLTLARLHNFALKLYRNMATRTSIINHVLHSIVLHPPKFVLKDLPWFSVQSVTQGLT